MACFRFDCRWVSQVGLGLIALLVTAIGEYVEGLRNEALRKTQKLIDDAAKLANSGATKGARKAGPTYEVEGQITHNHVIKKKRGGFGKLTIAAKRTMRELDRIDTKTGVLQAKKGSRGATSAEEGRRGGKMEP